MENKVATSDKATTAGTTKVAAKKVVEKKVAAKKVVEKAFKPVTLSSKDLSAANAAIKDSFKKLSHACKVVGNMSAKELELAFKDSSKVDPSKVVELVAQYDNIIKGYDLVSIAAKFVANIDGVHVVKKVWTKKDLITPNNDTDNRDKYQYVAIKGLKYKPAGLTVGSILSNDAKKPFITGTTNDTAITTYCYVRKENYTVAEVLNAIREFIALGEDRDRIVAKKITGNARAKAKKVVVEPVKEGVNEAI